MLSLAFGNWSLLPNFLSALSIVFNHPCCGAPERSLWPPWSEEEGWWAGDVVFRLQPGKRVSGVCYFCCPIASTWVTQGWVFIMLPGQVVRSEWSTHRHRRDSVSTVSVSRPPGSVKNYTLGGPGGRWDSKSSHQFLLSPSLPAGQMLFSHQEP